MSEPLNFKRIVISNVMGVDEMELHPKRGAITVVTGGNGTGKTTVIEAIRQVFADGRSVADATLIRGDKDEAQTVLVLDSGLEISRRQKRNGTAPITVRDAKLGVQNSPKARAMSLISGEALTPIDIINASPSERGMKVLSIAPIELSVDKIVEALGDVRREVPEPELRDDAHPIAKLRRIADLLRRQRTDVNGAAKQAKTTAERLQATVDSDAPDPDAVREELMEARGTIALAKEDLTRRETELRAELASRKMEIVESMNRELTNTRKEYDDLVADQRRQIAELEAQIADVERGFSIAKERLELAAEQQAIKAAANTNAEIERARTAYAEETGTLHLKVGELEQTMREADRSAETRRIIAEQKAAADQSSAYAARMTAAIERLRDLSLEISRELPVPDIEIGADGEIYRGGIPFTRLNREQQWDIAIDLATLRVGPVPLMLVDGLEELDAEHIEILRQKTKERGLYLIATYVDPAGGPLRVVDVDSKESVQALTGRTQPIDA